MNRYAFELEAADGFYYQMFEMQPYYSMKGFSFSSLTISYDKI